MILESLARNVTALPASRLAAFVTDLRRAPTRRSTRVLRLLVQSPNRFDHEVLGSSAVSEIAAAIASGSRESDLHDALWFFMAELGAWSDWPTTSPCRNSWPTSRRQAALRIIERVSWLHERIASSGANALVGAEVRSERDRDGPGSSQFLYEYWLHMAFRTLQRLYEIPPYSWPELASDLRTMLRAEELAEAVGALRDSRGAFRTILQALGRRPGESVHEKE